MILALVLLYVVSLVYISITERFRSYASLVGLQGWLLLAIALVRLQQIEIWGRCSSSWPRRSYSRRSSYRRFSSP